MLNRNVAELGDSEGARRRIDAVRGESVLVRVNRCGNGFNTFEDIGWLMDGMKLVGGSYLRSEMIVRRFYPGAWVRMVNPPYTHEENLASLRGDVFLVFEEVGEPKQTSSIARRTLREYNDGTLCPFPHIL